MTSANAEEVAAIHQANTGYDASKVKVSVALEQAPTPWRLRDDSALDADDEEGDRWISSIKLSNHDHADFCWVSAPVRGILVNEDTRTIIVANYHEVSGGNTPLWPDTIPEPIRSAQGALLSKWRLLWEENNLERLWRLGPSFDLHVWAAQDDAFPGYSSTTGWSVRIGTYDWAAQPRPREDSQSLTWHARGSASFIVSRSHYVKPPLDLDGVREHLRGDAH